MLDFNALCDALDALVPITHVPRGPARDAEVARREQLYTETVAAMWSIADALAAGLCLPGLSTLTAFLARHMEWLEWELDALAVW